MGDWLLHLAEPRTITTLGGWVDFATSFTSGAAQRRHQRLGIDDAYPWSTLDPANYPPALIERARIGWTENAFNEYCTFAAMGQLVQCLALAQAPLDLCAMASTFALEEAVHVELCARISERLGGLYPRRFDPSAIPIALDRRLTHQQRATEMVVRVCCVGEAFSLPMLTGAMRSATHPLTRAVLTTIVRDEAEHGHFGYLYLDHVSATLGPAERKRLGRIAAGTLSQYAPLWQRLESRVRNGVTSEGFLVAQVRDLGWMLSSDYAALAHTTVRREVLEPLAARGITVPWPP